MDQQTPSPHIVTARPRRRQIIPRGLRRILRVVIAMVFVIVATLPFAGAPAQGDSGGRHVEHVEKVAAGGVIELVVTGRGGVPVSGVGAVALNVTVTNPSASSFLTVWPTGAVMPLAANLNFLPGQTVPNMVIAKVGAGGSISMFNFSGSVDVVVDVMGWFPEGSAYNGLTPARLLDTRESASVADRGVRELVVTGRGGVPVSGVGAVALNVTVTNPSASSFLTVWPTGAVMPLAANLNFLPGQTVPNMVIAKVGAGGSISMFNFSGSVDVVVDVMGWFPEGSAYNGLTPARLLDTRESASVAHRGVRELVVTGRGGVPVSGVGAVALNVTVTNPSASSFLTVWPTGAVMPLAANLNFLPGQTVPNMVIAKVGAGGSISMFNFSGSVDVVVDVMGWFPEGSAYNGLTPARLLDTRESDPMPLPSTTSPSTTAPSTTTPATTTPSTSAPTGPTVIQPGAWDGIPAGRYVMEHARANCFWERFGDAGVGPTRLGSSFQFHDGRTVVDISGFESFSFTAECGPLTRLPATGTPAATIPRGSHVVGHHIQPGMYRIVLGPGETGCGWSRLTSFSGGAASFAEGMFISDEGEALVEVRASDVGFEQDCGTWTKIG